MKYKITNKALILILLLTIFFSLLIWYLDLYSFKELMSQSDKDKMKTDMTKSEDEIAKKSGTSEAQEMEKLKTEYKGDTTGAVYVKDPDYEKQPDNIIPPINSLGPFQARRQEIIDKQRQKDIIWGGGI